MVFMTMPFKTVCASMVGTETVLAITQVQNARENILNFLGHKDVQESMIAQGIDPLKAKARVDSLSDAEIMRIADKMDQLPAGGSDLGILVGTALVVFLVLLFTDIAGYTDVFPFVKHRN